MKILLERKYKIYDDRLVFIDHSKEMLFKKHGIEIIEDETKAKHCDIVMTHQNGNGDFETSKKYKKPIIILQRSDSATIHSKAMRKMIKTSQVIGFFKITNFKNIYDHNLDLIGERRHLEYINQLKYKAEKQEIQFNEKELNKIKCALPAYYNFRFDHIRNVSDQNDIFSNKRNVYINFAGTVDYSSSWEKGNFSCNKTNLLNLHRKKAYNSVMNISSKYQNIQQHILSHYGNFMNQPNYWQSLFNTKICISPWGYGEYNWRDFEAIYLGALLLKPDTDFIESYCDLYQKNIFYKTFKPDYSDFEKTCIDILNNFNSEENTSIRKNALNTLKDNYNIEKICNRFAKQIKECLQ